MFFKEGQGSEKHRLCCRQLPGGSDSQGRSGGKEAGEGGGKEFSRRSPLEAGYGAEMDVTKMNALIIELQRILEHLVQHPVSLGQQRPGKESS